MQGSILSVSCRALLAACDGLGLDGDALVRQAGLDRAVIDDPDGRLEPLDVMALWDRAETASGDPHLALRVARMMPRGAYRILEYLGASAPTVGAAFTKISEYFAWVDTTATLPITESADLCGFGLDAPVPADRVPLRAVEFTFGTSWLKVCDLTGQSFRPERIELGVARSGEAQALEHFFECPLLFSSGHNRMLVSREAWELPSRSADPSLLSLLEQHARALLESVAEERTVARDVKRLLRDAGPALGLPEAAKRLGVSERTLQRRLADETCVYADLVSSVREEMARQLMLDRKVAIAEAAFILGFSDQSSFTRSFKRWTGQTPAAFRAEHRTGTAAQIS